MYRHYMDGNGFSFNGNSSFGASAGNAARPVPDWSPRSVPPWKFGLRVSDDRGSL